MQVFPLSKPMVKTAKKVTSKPASKTAKPAVTPLSKPMVKTAKNVVSKPASKTANPVNHRARWTMSQDDVLVRAFEAKATPELIALLSGRTVAAIASRLHSLGYLVFDKDALVYSTAPVYWCAV